MGPVLFGRFFGVSGSFRGQGRKVNMWLGLQPDGAVRHDNAIGTGSIPKMASLAGFDTAGSVEPAFAMATPKGTRTKS
jgi:hypothetical protein